MAATAATLNLTRFKTKALVTIVLVARFQALPRVQIRFGRGSRIRLVRQHSTQAIACTQIGLPAGALASMFAGLWRRSALKRKVLTLGG